MPLQQDGKSFGSDSLRPGDSYQFAFTEPGTFAYHGQPHPWQRRKNNCLASIKQHWHSCYQIKHIEF